MHGTLSDTPIEETQVAQIKTVEEMRERIGQSIPGLEEKNTDRLDDFARSFIAKTPFIVMATSDHEGHLDASPKGDAPGFVVVEDDRTLLIPDRPGNKLAYGLENLLSNPRIGLLFMIPGTQETLRVNGRAELHDDAELLERLAARGKAATLAIRVHVEECFFHCGKAMIRSKLWQPDHWGERHEVSFGKMAARRMKLDASVADAYDKAVADDYENNL